MVFMRIGLPKTKIEEFNRLVCEEAVGHYSHLFYDHEREAFEKKYVLLPDNKKRQELENEIVKLIGIIEDHSFHGASSFRNNYFEYVDDVLRNDKKLRSTEFIIGHITHSFLMHIKWNLGFTEQDYKDARASDGPDYVFLIQNTDLLERYPDIDQMASMLAYCLRLFDVKLMLEELDKREAEISILESTTETDIRSLGNSGESEPSRKSMLQQIIEELCSNHVYICDLIKAPKLAAYLVGDYEPNKEVKEKLQIKVDNRQFKLLYDFVKKKFHPIISQKKIETDEFLLAYNNSEPLKSSSLSEAIYKEGHTDHDKATPPRDHEVFIKVFDKIP